MAEDDSRPVDQPSRDEPCRLEESVLFAFYIQTSVEVAISFLDLLLLEQVIVGPYAAPEGHQEDEHARNGDPGTGIGQSVAQGSAIVYLDIKEG